jgi:hypothetical protein
VNAHDVSHSSFALSTHDARRVLRKAALRRVPSTWRCCDGSGVSEGTPVRLGASFSVLTCGF